MIVSFTVRSVEAGEPAPFEFGLAESFRGEPYVGSEPQRQAVILAAYEVAASFRLAPILRVFVSGGFSAEEVVGEAYPLDACQCVVRTAAEIERGDFGTFARSCA